MNWCETAEAFFRCVCWERGRSPLKRPSCEKTRPFHSGRNVVLVGLLCCSLKDPDAFLVLPAVPFTFQDKYYRTVWLNIANPSQMTLKKVRSVTLISLMTIPSATWPWWSSWREKQWNGSNQKTSWEVVRWHLKWTCLCWSLLFFISLFSHLLFYFYTFLDQEFQYIFQKIPDAKRIIKNTHSVFRQRICEKRYKIVSKQ